MKLKRIFFLVFVLIFSSRVLPAQESAPVAWTIESKRLSGNVYELQLKGRLKEGWHVYYNAPPDLGLMPPELGFADSNVHKTGALKVNGNIKKINDALFEKELEIADGDIDLVQEIEIHGTIPAALRVSISYNAANKEEFLPVTGEKLEVKLQGGVAVNADRFKIKITSLDKSNPVAKCGGDESGSDHKDKGLLTIFLLGFIGGLIAFITPCVFPMIPLTVSFFTKMATNRQRGIRNATVYGFYIFLIYVLLSLPFHVIGKISPDIFNNISTNIYLNIIFFLVFLFFAFSFFGYYEIALPARFTAKLGTRTGAGNLLGIFFMALTLAIVSFSCTGPILGSLLAGTLSGDGGAWQLTAGMGGFGLALALPFALFALFPNWLSSLPKSGGWLNTVKVVLGFIELALAFKFLSNADLVQHWGILKREIFIGIWVACGIGIVLYLFGKIRFPHDSALEKLGKGRIIAALLFALLTLYLVPGLTKGKYANLPLISGFPPPLFYSVYPQKSNCALGLNCVKDYEEGLELSRKLNKPMLLDFTGWACVNCRRVEENVWVNSDVFKLINDQFILVSLYVDDRKQLPAGQQLEYTTTDGLDKEIKTVGDKWSTFQTENFAINSQPYYVIVSPDERVLNSPIAYTQNIALYKNWLQCGLDAFRKNSIAAKEQ